MSIKKLLEIIKTKNCILITKLSSLLSKHCFKLIEWSLWSRMKWEAIKNDNERFSHRKWFPFTVLSVYSTRTWKVFDFPTVLIIMMTLIIFAHFFFRWWTVTVLKVWLPRFTTDSVKTNRMDNWSMDFWSRNRTQTAHFAYTQNSRALKLVF